MPKRTRPPAVWIVTILAFGASDRKIKSVTCEPAAFSTLEKAEAYVAWWKKDTLHEARVGSEGVTWDAYNASHPDTPHRFTFDIEECLVD